jgi:hypothetical protein
VLVEELRGRDPSGPEPEGDPVLVVKAAYVVLHTEDDAKRAARAGRHNGGGAHLPVHAAHLDQVLAQ